MKFRDLERGPIEGRTEDFELPGGVVAKVRVMPLLAGRDGEIRAGAAAYVEAENKRFPDAPPALAQDGDPAYERGVYAHTIQRAILDPDDGTPFFASVDEILDPARGLDRPRLAYLFELQQQAQADFAPQIGTLTAAKYFEWLEKTAEAGDGADLPFEHSPRDMQRRFVRGIARSYRDLIAGTLAQAREIERLRSEISSLQGKSTSSPSSPDAATSLPDSAASSAGSETP